MAKKKETKPAQPTTEQLLGALVQQNAQLIKALSPILSVINDGLAVRDNNVAKQVAELLKQQEKDADKDAE